MPTTALLKAMPAIMLPTNMAERASRSAPLVVARGRLAKISFNASRQSPSDGELEVVGEKDSMQCVSASKPVAAVRRGGSEMVKSGSRMATSGNRNRLPNR